MAEEWIARVEGKEYGPVDTEALREWQREGRLIPTNEIQRVGTEDWLPANQLLPELFAEAMPEMPPPLPRPFEVAKTWREIGADTLLIYRAGFAAFMFFGLLTSVPMFILQWTLPVFPMGDFLPGNPNAGPAPVLPPICLAMLVTVILLWPISTAGFQFTADDILRGQRRSLSALLSEAMRCWGRVFGTALLVYGSYCFWLFVPLAAMMAPINSGNVLLVASVALIIGGFMIYMNARLFINFLFWQQTVVLDGPTPLAALRESKELARSIPDGPPLDRPLYRGAIVASAWLLVLLMLSFVVQMVSIMVRVVGAANFEEGLELARQMAQAQTPDALVIAASVIVAVINLLLRPLLAAAFVVLYYDAKARSGRTSDR